MLPLLMSVALAFDHDYRAYARAIEGAVTPAGVRYDAVRVAELDQALAAIATAPVDTFSRAEKLAFWVNAYDMLTVDLILDSRPLASIRDLDGGKVWSTRRFAVAGASLTLDDIEHKRARTFGDPRVHAVLNCASKGCPPLPARPVRAASLDDDLNAGVALWVGTNAYKVEGGTLYLSQIFKWYEADFATAEAIPGADAVQSKALRWLGRWMPDQTVTDLRAGRLKLEWQRYDWRLNEVTR
jgi:hypothetical protein